MIEAEDDELEPISRDEEILDELAELGLALARGLQARALAAEAAQEAGALSMAFQRVARSVRQALALKGKLRRDEADGAREARREIQIATRRAIHRRKTLVEIYVRRAIAEHTPLDQEDLGLCRFEDLMERLDERLLDESFLEAPFEEVIASLHRALGLPPPAFADEPPEGRPDAAPAIFSTA